MRFLTLFVKGCGVLLASAASMGAWLPKTLHILTWVCSFFLAIYIIAFPVYIYQHMSVVPLIEGLIFWLVVGTFNEAFAQLIDWRRSVDGS
jgi:hypothetical protein